MQTLYTRFVTSAGTVASRGFRARMPTALRSATTALALASCGCTSIAIYGADGKLLDSQTRFGLVDIAIPASTGAIAISRSDIGLSAGSGTLTLGASRQILVKILDPERCQAVLVATDPDSAREIYAMPERRNEAWSGLCLNSNFGGEKR